ncbi:MAG TPA: polyphosphate kinase [Actinobacteria bacterium]|nr:polyphosphate kinase [Actinomycetota bacterium]
MDQYRIAPGTTVHLADHDPADESWCPDGKDGARSAAKKATRRLEELQELLYAQGRHRLLVVLQAMDTGGKDGVIRRVFEGVNPLGVKVASFKKPSPADLAHDYLWRIHPHVPGNGEIAIFNRSHYEDVLVVRVHSLVPPERWERRYDHINAFERLLADEGTTILKFFLHISRDEQAARLRSRLEDPAKQWKFAKGDLEERALWDDYVTAYEAALSRTSTAAAPWHVVPADKKWYRDFVIGRILVDALESLQMSFPPPADDLAGIVVE